MSSNTGSFTPFEPDTGLAAYHHGWDEAVAHVSEKLRQRIDTHHASGRLSEASECEDVLTLIEGGEHVE